MNRVQIEKQLMEAHAVCVPSPAQGHINAMLQLAKLLHRSGFHVTFVHTRSTYDRILDSCGPLSLNGLPRFRFEAIDDGVHASGGPITGEGLSDLCGLVRSRLARPFRELCKRLNESDGPKISCIVSDTFSSYTLDVAAELGVPDLSFCSVGACGFWAFFKFKELFEQRIIPLKSEDDLHNGYLDTHVDWVPAKTMRLRDFPSFIRTTDYNDSVLNFCKDESQDARKATAIILNTFDELEGSVLATISSVLPGTYAIGPLNLMCRQISDEALRSIRFDLWTADSRCSKWLDEKLHRSVVYVNFGSLTTMASGKLIEFAWGLANSDYNFLWVIRPNITGGDYVDLPEEFLSEVIGRGLLVSWCDQAEVLMHPAIGGFLTHCGWNSIMESISAGIPMLCWPYFGDQQINCRFLCHEFGVGIEINNDVKREEVTGLIKELFGGEKGNKMRKMAMAWKERAIGAVKSDGKSSLNLERVMNDVLLQHDEKF